jgi:putative DNA methylase
MLTWGALHVVSGSPDSRVELECKQKQLVKKVESEIVKLDVENDGDGWRIKALLYCVNAPPDGLDGAANSEPPISKPRTGQKINVIAELIPDHVGSVTT